MKERHGLMPYRTRRRLSRVVRRSAVEGRRRTSRIESLRPQMARAYRLLRAASRLGIPGSIPGPPELLPAGARVLAQGYLNRFSMPLLSGWLLPRWMREQSDPACDWFVPRSVTNLMVNQTRRNWTALGIPGSHHPVESLVDRWGLLTPVPGGPSLDWWVRVEGDRGEMGWIAAAEERDARQKLEHGLPVVVTSYEAEGLRVSSEAWMLPASDADWAAMRVVLVNMAGHPLRGTFAFALRPYNPEGIAPVYHLTFTGTTFTADGRPGPYTWPHPDRHALSGLRQGDLFGRWTMDDGRWTMDDGRWTMDGDMQAHLDDPHGFAHGILEYDFLLEPGEEAEFLAFTPVHRRRPASAEQPAPLFTLRDSQLEAAELRPATIARNPQHYAQAKEATTLEWRSILDSGMQVELPHGDLQASWDANRAHLLALHDGDSITPGPDLYHSFWFRDAAYMTYALAATGYREASARLIRGFMKRQRRDGAFVSHLGEWDGTGQVLWCAEQQLALHPDADMLAEVRPALERGAKWITSTLARSPGGLMPPGVSSEHFGPPDRYYWDSIWALAGLRAAARLFGDNGNKSYKHAAVRLRRAIASAWAGDMALLGRQTLVAAPGRGIDLGMIGTLVSWFPLQLLPADSPLLESTLTALEEALFYEGALFVNTGHSGWGTYLNMRVVGCRLLQGSLKGWELMLWLLGHASPTYNWPEAINTRSLGGSAGDGQHGWASAEWLLLVRALLFQEEESRLTLCPVFPPEWLLSPGHLSVDGAPTRFGPLSYSFEWDGDCAMRLEITSHPSSPEIVWRPPAPVRELTIDGVPAELPPGNAILLSGAKNVSVKLLRT